MDDRLTHFESEIDRQESQLFGIYLFCRCIELMYQDSPETLAKTKYHYDEIVERGNAAIHDAKILLSQIKVGTRTEEEIDAFRFPPIEGLPGLDEMTQRSRILVRTYHRLFPDKSRYDATKLSQEELTLLLQESAEQL